MKHMMCTARHGRVARVTLLSKKNFGSKGLSCYNQDVFCQSGLLITFYTVCFVGHRRQRKTDKLKLKFDTQKYPKNYKQTNKSLASVFMMMLLYIEISSSKL